MVSRVMPFNRCDTSECVRIQIVNDLVLEGDESFDISLRSVDLVQNIAFSPSHVTVRIYGDNDSELYTIPY